MADEEQLRAGLAKALGWEPSLVESVVGALLSASSKSEVEDVIANFMGNDPAARNLVEAFLAKQAAARAAARKGVPPHHVQSLPAAPAGSHAQGGSLSSGHMVMQEFQHQGGGGTRQAGSIQARVAKPSKRGAKAARGGRQAGGAEAGPAGAGRPREPVRRVVNCLSCGKIYDIRANDTDTKLFLQSDGRCTFCGDPVPSLYGDAPSAGGGTAEDALDGEELAAHDAVALELKDRLVEYDRNAAKRTSVIDDQSDYFAIDTNVWLDDSERRRLIEQQRAVEEAEAEAGRRITVAIDLMGRQVVVDQGNPVGKAGASAQKQDTSGFGFASAADDRREQMAEAAAEANAREIPQGGGSAVADAELHALRNMRISANPQLNGAPSPLFLPRPAAPETAEPAKLNAPSSSTTASSSQQPAAKKRTGRRKAAATKPPTRAPRRLQHDDPFDGMAALSAAPAASADGPQPPFDICPSHPDSPLSIISALRELASAAAGSARAEVLGDGLVLLRGWLSLEQQLAVVQALRALGLGTGGFYTPSYTGGARLRLRMMCLGWHWEPRTAEYEAIRSSYDGAAPPPIPEPLLALVERAASDASAAAGREAGNSALPGVRPDVCLCNFYEKQGRLGMHQDRDESAASLKAGAPVVSFSIGDSCEFVYGRSRDETTAQSLQLNSGDALLFGGASRMLFHGVRTILPGTAPPSLLAASYLRPGRLNLTFRQL